jgi:hypothetical protein
MQAHYDIEFAREHGCTEAEWRGWLPGAAGPHPLTLGPAPQARVELAPGRLELAWEPLPPRRIALITLPRLRVHYRFVGVAPERRLAFMRHFDLFLQRGGG